MERTFEQPLSLHQGRAVLMAARLALSGVTGPIRPPIDSSVRLPAAPPRTRTGRAPLTTGSRGLMWLSHMKRAVTEAEMHSGVSRRLLSHIFPVLNPSQTGCCVQL